MAVNPNIALSVRGLELPDPLAQYGKVQAIQAAQQQNALAQMQMQQAQREVAQRNALNRAYAQAYSPEGQFDINRLRTSLATGGFGSHIPAAEEQYFKTQQARTKQLDAETELALKKMSLGRETLGVLNPQDLQGYQGWLRSQFSDPQMKEIYDSAGITLDQALARADQAAQEGTLGDLIRASAMTYQQLQDQIKPTTQFVELPTGEKVAMSVVPGQAPVELARYEAGMTPSQQRQAQTEERRIALEQRRIALQEREQDPAFQQAKAAAQEEGKLAARDVNTAINTIPTMLEEAGRGISILTQMIGERDAKGKLLPDSKPHPGFGSAVGTSLTPGARLIPGTEASNFDSLFNQIQGQAFLQAFERLKGAGQITEIEGIKATQAITSLSLAQSEEQFIKAAMELQDVIDSLSERAVNRYNRLTAGREDVAPMTYVPLSREGKSADRARRLDDLLSKGGRDESR